MNESRQTDHRSRNGPSHWVWGLALFVFCFALFSLTGSKLRFGYLGENIDQAEAMLTDALRPRPEGGIAPFAKTGLLEVAAYLPFAAVKVALEQRGIGLGLRQIVYVFVEPFYTAWLCLVFFGLALRLYKRAATAAALTLILALATMVWPYSKFGMETQITLWTLVGLWALVGYAERPTAGKAAWLGLAIAAVLLTKITGLLHAAWLIFAIGWLKLEGRWWRRPRALRDSIVIVGMILAGVLIFLLSNRWRFGGWVWGGRYGLHSEMQPIALWESAWAFLLSPNKSLFLYSPPALVALWFLGAFWRRFPAMRPALIGALLVTLFHLSARTWAEETWGPRRMHYLVPLMALPLGIWWERRGELRGWVRRLGWVVIAFGLWVQAVAVSFDYTALAFTLGFRSTFTQERYLWDPQYNHLRFNLHLLASARRRADTGQSLPYVLQDHVMDWTLKDSDPRPQPQLIPIPDGRDRLDFWYLQQRADWPDRPYWFVSGSSWLAVGLALAALGILAWLIAQIRRHSFPDAARAIDPGGD
jgi:hypothetical protein